MATNYTAPFGRIRYYDVIVPMSEVQEIELRTHSGTPTLRFYYKNSDNYNSIDFDSKEQREEFLEKLNQYMGDLTHELRNESYTPELGWIDLTPPPEPKKPITAEINEVIDEINETLDAQEEFPAQTVSLDKLEPEDKRPAWQKLLKPQKS